MIVKCNNCKKDFKKSNSEIKRTKTGCHYCSKSCSAQFNNLGVTRNKPVARKCKKCDSNFTCQGKHRSISFCQDCFPRWGEQSNWFKNLTLQEYHNKNSVKSKHPSWANSHIRNFCRSWNKDLRNLPCQRCSYSFHVELCHIKPISSFSGKTTLREINSPDNILILCRNCHWEFDNGKLQIESIPFRIPN